MLRITEFFEDDNTVTLRLDGRLVNSSALELVKLSLYHRDEQNKTVQLDFSGVTFIDDSSIRKLETLKSERIKIINYNPFVKILLLNLLNYDRKE